MSRIVFSALLLLAACGPVPTMPDGGTMVNLGSPAPSPTSPSPTGSPNALGPCTGPDGSACGGGKGACFSSSTTATKQCLAVAEPGKCPRGSLGAQYRDGLVVCVDLCSTVRDCAAGFFCDSNAVITNERGVVELTQVCVPGSVNHAGQTCTTQSDCEKASTDLACVGNEGSASICTRACSTTADCGAGADRANVVCARTTNGAGVCMKACTPGASAACGTGLSCSAGGHCVPTSSGGGATTFPTPAAGQIGGACSTHAQCGSGRFCDSNDPGGSCVSSCTSAAQCGATNECVKLTAQSPTSYCFPKCSQPGTQSNCRAGYSCQAMQGTSYGFCLSN
jgi:hypothetical protein